MGCVIKAAGRAERFGRNKLLEPLEGKEILSHVLDAVPRERLGRLVAVVSKPQVAELCMSRGITALLYEGGPVSETIRLGVGAMEDMDGCMFVMGDQPLCSRKSMERMLDSFQDEPDCIVRLSHNGSPGSPVIFPRRLFSKLSALSGERGGMSAAKGEEDFIRLVEVQDAAELWDVDTEQALAEMEDYLRCRQ